MGADGYLHLTGHNHGTTNVNGSWLEECPHYVSIKDNNNNNDDYGIKWQYVNMMKTFGEYPNEPAPVYPNGVPGDQGGVPKYFIQFVQNGNNPLHIDLMQVKWASSV